MKIGFFMICHNFQLRLCHVLSSIVQQVNPPELVIYIAGVKNNGNPTTEEIIEFYKNMGLNISFIEIDENKIKKPGYVRNRQVKDAPNDLDYYYFADTDHVYPNLWFYNIFKNLPLLEDSLFYSSKFIITNVDATNEFIKNNSNQTYIEDVYNKCFHIPILKITNKSIAGGNCNIISKSTMTKLGYKYVDEYLEIQEKKDWWFHCHQWFRTGLHKLGLTSFNIRDIVKLTPIHLNHDRYRTEVFQL